MRKQTRQEQWNQRVTDLPISLNHVVHLTFIQLTMYCVMLFTRCYIHRKISVVAAGDLAPRWHQDICNHRDDVGGRYVLGVISNSCSLECLTGHSKFWVEVQLKYRRCGQNPALAVKVQYRRCGQNPALASLKYHLYRSANQFLGINDKTTQHYPKLTNAAMHLH